jgi:hypothetical protein
MPAEYMITLEPRENIDHSFVAIVEQILDNTLQLHQPAEVYVVQIDNWFDHKWLEFDSNRNDSDELGCRLALSASCISANFPLHRCFMERRHPIPCTFCLPTDLWRRFAHRALSCGIPTLVTGRIKEV